MPNTAKIAPHKAAARTKRQRLATARRVLSPAKASSAGQGPRIPRNATPDRAFIRASVNYRRAAEAYMQAVSAWHAFAAGQDFEDPAHAEHHRRVTGTRQALCRAQFEFSASCAAIGVEA